MRPLRIVDVFGQDDFSGNPLAVVADGDRLSSEEMLRITRWLNFSETAFLCSPTDREADYRVRIFTPDRELTFAGHPTLGSCHAWLEGGGKAKKASIVKQQCGAGIIPVRVAHNHAAFVAPPILRGGPVDHADLVEIAAFLNIASHQIVDAAWVDNGPGWVGILLASAEAVLDVEPVRKYPHKQMDVGIIGAHPAGSDVAFEIRTFFSDQHRNIVEDPVTGSFQASAAMWLLNTGRASAPYVAAQGTRLGRTGRVSISVDSDGVWVGGRTRTLFQGTCAG